MNGLSALARQVAASTSALSGPIHQHLSVTPLISLPAVSEICAARILLKCEHRQVTGSFKPRGALARLLSLGAGQRRRGVVAASTGNHGIGVAYALSVLGGTGIVCVPRGASPVKVAAIRRLGVEVRAIGEVADETERLARRLAEKEQLAYVSPYNDLDVIAGQGTVGAEIAGQLGDRGLDAIVVPAGGGGLVSGIAATVKSALPGVSVIAASPVNDAAMAASVRASRVVEVEVRPTISDATAGGLEPGSVTLPLCAELVDEWVLLEEPEICSALRLMIDAEHQLIEGAAALAVAAGLKVAGRGRAGQTIALVATGANISSAALAEAIRSAPPLPRPDP